MMGIDGTKSSESEIFTTILDIGKEAMSYFNLGHVIT